MKIKSAIFISSGTRLTHYPKDERLEIAFAGRSNVGKSSLINRLLNRRKLVKTSSTPGRTQTVNFFLINDDFYFVDLPGYGYAKVPESVRLNWGPMTEVYLRTRQRLSAVVVLMDIRRVPNEADHTLLQWLDHYNVPQIIVLTKADKLKPNERIKQHKAIAEQLAKPASNLILFSAESDFGSQALWEQIEFHMTNMLSPKPVSGNESNSL